MQKIDVNSSHETDKAGDAIMDNTQVTRADSECAKFADLVEYHIKMRS